MNRFTAGLLDAEGIVDAHLGAGGKIGRIGKFFITDLLDGGILGGIDL